MQTNFDLCSTEQSCSGELAGLLLGTVGAIFSSETSYLKDLTLPQVLAINLFSYGYGKVACFSRMALLQCLNGHNCSCPNASDQQLPSNSNAFMHSMARVAALHALGFTPGYCTTMPFSFLKMPFAKAITCCICFTSASLALPMCFSIFEKIHKYCLRSSISNAQEVDSQASTIIESQSGYQADEEMDEISVKLGNRD